ncbi:hypothetical protein [Candidatus Hecatella orcuttiae]|uniref:hypothetical protein n=1 Tax=Candidatus Hecatella orcuttiae TaxID=1935119 RepID=UPI0028682CBD|nr:hypothetical protein [Candidatus Hecatella orcuttiae]
MSHPAKSQYRHRRALLKGSLLPVCPPPRVSAPPRQSKGGKAVVASLFHVHVHGVKDEEKENPPN